MNLGDSILCARSLAIVGNAPTELGLGRGAEIDAHEHVVRFNNAPTAGHEQDYGARMDGWAMTAPATNPDVRPRDPSTFQAIFCTHAAGQRRALRAGFSAVAKRIFYCPSEFMGALAAIRAGDGKRFSTGTMFLWWVFCRRWGDMRGVNAYGFNGMRDVPGAPMHYYDNLINPHSHDASTELRLYRMVFGVDPGARRFSPPAAPGDIGPWSGWRPAGAPAPAAASRGPDVERQREGQPPASPVAKPPASAPPRLAVVVVAWHLPDPLRLGAWLKWNAENHAGARVYVVSAPDEYSDLAAPENVTILPFPAPLKLFAITRTANFGIRRAIDDGATVVVKTDIDLWWASAWAAALARVAAGGVAVFPRFTMAADIESARAGKGFVDDRYKGAVAMTAADWARVRGYHEGLCGYGWDDAELWIRCQKAGIKPIRIPEPMYHVGHSAASQKPGQRADQWGRKTGQNPANHAHNRRAALRAWDSADWGRAAPA